MRVMIQAFIIYSFELKLYFWHSRNIILYTIVITNFIMAMMFLMVQIIEYLNQVTWSFYISLKISIGF